MLLLKEIFEAPAAITPNDEASELEMIGSCWSRRVEDLLYIPPLLSRPSKISRQHGVEVSLGFDEPIHRVHRGQT